MAVKKKKKRAGKSTTKPQTITQDHNREDSLGGDSRGRDSLDEDSADQSSAHQHREAEALANPDADSDDDNVASERPAPAPAPAPRGRTKRRPATGPDADPNIPRPSGQASQSGGLIFLGVVVGLIVLAITLQFILG